jgi:hypothetical protein
MDPMLELLREAWRRNPDQRLGQLIANAGREHSEAYPYGRYRDPFGVEDDQMWRGLERMAKGASTGAEGPG